MTRQPGSLRLVSKQAKGTTYQRWQWRTHRRTDIGWRTVDVELGQDITGLRTRVLVALGDLSAPLLLERWVRWRFRKWDDLPAWSGQPAALRGLQRAAWWVEVPKAPGQPVKVRFRSLDGAIDYRRRSRSEITETTDACTDIWKTLNADPVLRLAELLWFQREGQRCADEVNQRLDDLKRDHRKGDLSHRDYEADQRDALARLDDWEGMVSTVDRRYDEALLAMVQAMPRTTRDHYQTRILARADKLLNDPKQQQRWTSDHWNDSTLTWG